MKWAISAFAILCTACATQPENIRTSYVSELQYKDHNCDQLAAEASHVTRKVNELHGNLKTTANNDAAQMGVGLIFWPTLFLLEGGDGVEAQEYARLKGERDTIEKVAIKKECAIKFEPLVKKPEPKDES